MRLIWSHMWFLDVVIQICIQFFLCFFLQGVKLGGYVSWVQGVEYPECPDCKVDMKTTFLQVKYIYVNNLLLDKNSDITQKNHLDFEICVRLLRLKV